MTAPATVKDFGVVPVSGECGRYHVRSSGRSGVLYLVDLEELTSGWCSCPHFEFKIGISLGPVSECKHIRSAKVYRMLQQNFVKGLRA